MLQHSVREHVSAEYRQQRQFQGELEDVPPARVVWPSQHQSQHLEELDDHHARERCVGVLVEDRQRYHQQDQSDAAQDLIVVRSQHVTRSPGQTRTVLLEAEVSEEETVLLDEVEVLLGAGLGAAEGDDPVVDVHFVGQVVKNCEDAHSERSVCIHEIAVLARVAEFLGECEPLQRNAERNVEQPELMNSVQNSVKDRTFLRSHARVEKPHSRDDEPTQYQKTQNEVGVKYEVRRMACPSESPILLHNCCLQVASEQQTTRGTDQTLHWLGDNVLRQTGSFFPPRHFEVDETGPEPSSLVEVLSWDAVVQHHCGAQLGSWEQKSEQSSFLYFLHDLASETLVDDIVDLLQLLHHCLFLVFEFGVDYQSPQRPSR